MDSSINNIGLTATEVSNVWSAYIKSSMESRFFEYFLATTEENDIKNVVEKMLHIAQKSIQDLKGNLQQRKSNCPS